MTTIEQTEQVATFPASTTASDGRSTKTELIVEASRRGEAYVTLEISTSHRPKYGYATTVTRASIDGYSRSVILGVGGGGDTTRLSLTTPASTRFNRNTLAALQTEAVAHVERNIGEWITWAELSEAHQRRD